MQFKPMITIGEYTDLFLTVMLGLGVIFEMPILVFFLSLMGVVSAGWMWRNLRYSILVIFIIAAIVTPTTDIVNMCIFAAPMVALYVISIGVAFWCIRNAEESAFDDDMNVEATGDRGPWHGSNGVTAMMLCAVLISPPVARTGSRHLRTPSRLPRPAVRLTRIRRLRRPILRLRPSVSTGSVPCSTCARSWPSARVRREAPPIQKLETYLRSHLRVDDLEETLCGINPQRPGRHAEFHRTISGLPRWDDRCSQSLRPQPLPILVRANDGGIEHRPALELTNECGAEA